MWQTPATLATEGHSWSQGQSRAKGHVEGPTLVSAKSEGQGYFCRLPSVTGLTAGREQRPLLQAGVITVSQTAVV